MWGFVLRNIEEGLENCWRITMDVHHESVFSSHSKKRTYDSFVSGIVYDDVVTQKRGKGPAQPGEAGFSGYPLPGQPGYVPRTSPTTVVMQSRGSCDSLQGIMGSVRDPHYPLPSSATTTTPVRCSPWDPRPSPAVQAARPQLLPSSNTGDNLHRAVSLGTAQARGTAAATSSSSHSGHSVASTLHLEVHGPSPRSPTSPQPQYRPARRMEDYFQSKTRQLQGHRMCTCPAGGLCRCGTYVSSGQLSSAPMEADGPSYSQVMGLACVSTAIAATAFRLCPCCNTNRLSGSRSSGAVGGAYLSGDAASDVWCGYCQRQVCVSCTEQCEGCSDRFCRACHTQDYSGRYAATVCIDCRQNRDVGGDVYMNY